MGPLRRLLPPVALLAAAAVLGGCASSSAGSGRGSYTGIQLYKKGEGVYVCRDAHTAPSQGELVRELERGEEPGDPPTGQSVRIAQQETVQVGESSTRVARVEAEEGGGSYWIPYTALCSRSGS